MRPLHNTASDAVLRRASLWSGELVRTMIQWLLSQFRAGNLKIPVKVAPACSWIVLPHWAAFKAACRSSPAFTLMTDPGAGVSVIELATVAIGSCAGPS